MALSIREFSSQATLSIVDLYKQVRSRTMQIVVPLETEDYVIQTADFMSPPRWHIGHTSWFFETVLRAHLPGYKVYSEDYLFYFNSYYEGFGARMFARQAGLHHLRFEVERVREIAVGVKVGETIQHVVGMKGARTIVAINKDSNAPIFEIADYGVIGDIFEIMPALTEELQKVR